MFDDKFFNKIDPVANSYARTMSDKLGGDMGSFRTVKMQTAEGTVTMQTKGDGRPQLTLEAVGQEPVIVPTLQEVDLSGAKTQSDRLYYHDKDVDTGATEYRVWSSDGLLSMLVKPLRRIIFKTSGIAPARTFSVWLADDSVEEIAAPVPTGDGLPAAVEITSPSRTFHDTVYVYDKGDGGEYASLLGLAFAIKRIKALSFLFKGVTHTLNLIGFDNTGAPIVEAGTAACGNLIEKAFSARSYGPKLKSLKANPVSVRLAEEGGLIPFAVKATTVNPLEFTHKLSDLSKLEAFGQPWHGYYECDGTTRNLWSDITKTTLLHSSPAVTGAIFPESSEGEPYFRYYKFGQSDIMLGENHINKDAGFSKGFYGPIPGITRLNSNECLCRDASNRVWVVSLSQTTEGIGTLSISRLFDDVMSPTSSSVVLATLTRNTSVGYVNSPWGIVVSPNGKEIVIIAYQTGGIPVSINRYWKVTFSGSGSLEAGSVGVGITATAVEDFLTTTGGPFDFMVEPFKNSTYSVTSFGEYSDNTSPVQWAMTRHVETSVTSAEGKSVFGDALLIDIVYNRSSSTWEKVVSVSIYKSEWVLSGGWSVDVEAHCVPGPLPVHTATRSVNFTVSGGNFSTTFSVEKQVGVYIGQTFHGQSATYTGSDPIETMTIQMYFGDATSFTDHDNAYIDAGFNGTNTGGMNAEPWAYDVSPNFFTDNQVSVVRITPVQGFNNASSHYKNAICITGKQIVYDGKVLSPMTPDPVPSVLNLAYNPLNQTGFIQAVQPKGIFF